MPDAGARLPGILSAWRRSIAWTGLTLNLVASPIATQAQQVRRGTTPLDLPRPGYEPRSLRVGPLDVRIEADVSALYDSNVYATSRDASDDLIVYARPRVEADWTNGTNAVHAEAYGEARRHANFARENATSFGAAVEGSFALGPRHSVTTAARYDRAIESRADPEARAPITARPRRIDILSADFAYRYSGSRLAITLAPAIQSFDYLDPAERDRELKIYRANARATFQPAAPLAFFAEGYINRRDFGLAQDFNGIDRDATTVGLLVGASREVTGKLRGRLGVGYFRSSPDDPALTPFDGFAANGAISWSPRPRTLLTADIFRGDVATVRSGAAGRTDTSIAIRINQEARHNLLLDLGLGWLQSSFRGIVPLKQDTLTAAIGAEYLIDRRFSGFARASYAGRNADLDLREFSRNRFEIGLRVRY